jgi:hypothetical protein
MSGTKRATKRAYFIGERREAYLDCLRVTGSHRAAAREAGVSERAARRHRARKPEYEARCIEAVSEAQRRLAGAEGPFDAPLDPHFQSIRRGPGGKAKIVRTSGNRWTIRIEDRFFAALGATGNISAAARAIGFSRETIGKRRRKWPAFARRFEEMMEEAEIDLEYRLLCGGTGWSEAAEASEDEEARSPRHARSPSPAKAGKDRDVPLDPEFALKFLKWRDEKRRGVSGPKGGRGRIVEQRPIEEAIERIVAQVEAMKRHEERESKRREEEDKS